MADPALLSRLPEGDDPDQILEGFFDWLDETGIDGGPGVIAVLEINGGLAGALGIAPGTELRHPRLDQSRSDTTRLEQRLREAMQGRLARARDRLSISC